MKKAISENLEFITDRKILQQGADAKSYQYSLLYTCVNTSSNAIVNHFNISTIKKRIMMMNSKKSAAYNVTRYTFIVPAVLVLLLAFGTSKAALIKRSINNAVKTATHQAMNIVALTTDHTLTGISATKIDTGKSEMEIKSAKKQSDSILNKITDTIKHKIEDKLYIKLNKATLLDSVYYMINGEPGTVYQFKRINPADILNIEVLGAPGSVQLFGDEAIRGAILVVTKDGKNLESTKKIREKIAAYSMQQILDGYVKITQSDSTHSIKGKVDALGKSMYSVTGTYTGTYTGKGVVSASNSPDKITILPKPGNFQPLYVIDGTPNQKPIPPTLNADDVLSISILKDSVATALYGDKGKNGVIVITTKYSKKDTKP